MGSGRFDANEWLDYSTTRSYSTKSTAEIFDKKHIDDSLNPKNVVRESRDSTENPNSTPIILALDVTGSMGMIADNMARTGIPTLLTEIYNRKPVTDPHVMCMGIGDIECDRSPLQVTQFEADIRVSKQLELLYLEHGGGGNSYESYALAWYFAANRTITDSFEKRGKKGYLFTIGDEEPTRRLDFDALKSLLGNDVEQSITMEALLEQVSEKWEIFHIIVEEGNHCKSHKTEVVTKWTNLIGQRSILLSDYTKLAEVIVSAIQVVEGEDESTVAASWNGDTSLVVSKSIKDLSVIRGTGSALISL